MEITKDLLSQYSSMQSYVEELTLKKNRISKEMKKVHRWMNFFITKK